MHISVHKCLVRKNNFLFAPPTKGIDTDIQLKSKVVNADNSKSKLSLM